MKQSLRALAALCLAAGSVFASLPAVAGPYSSLTVFGDSLSDVGNIKIATNGAVPAAPYFNGRFSDGLNWIDTLAAGLGLPSASVASLAGGTNYAFGGARTGISGSPPGVLAQVVGLWGPSHATADPNGLYVVVGGGNDMRDARSAAGGTDATRQAAAEAAATNIFNSVAALAAKGAQHVLISTLPNLGNTPEAVLLGKVAESIDATNRYNAAIAGLEGMLEALFSDLDVMVLDMAAVGQGVIDDALNNNGATYGITNVTAGCFFVGNCGAALFSDNLHPSAAAYALIGNAALALVVPLPATAALLGAGLLVLGFTRRRRSERA
ncbi:MAG: SGNH/GDSL hydrolase family protein [Proteobacteria bacterium]|nr:SGNH/GDSL hydrolase family protein [Pseudomonadota bacterium]